jgi:hypothetical protein
VQVNIKAEETVRDKFNSICDQEGLIGGELPKRLPKIYDLVFKVSSAVTPLAAL